MNKVLIAALGLVALTFLAGFSALRHTPNTRVFTYNGQEVTTTFGVDARFMGKYTGRKGGYLELKANGTGLYHYDVMAFGLPACEHKPIELEWGFLVNNEGEVVKTTKPYGFSYPILLKATGFYRFKGCRETMQLDFLLEKKNGQITVSSSQDWKK